MCNIKFERNFYIQEGAICFQVIFKYTNKYNFTKKKRTIQVYYLIEKFVIIKL